MIMFINKDLLSYGFFFFKDFLFHGIVIIIIITFLAQQRDTYYKSVTGIHSHLGAQRRKLNILLCVSSLYK